MCLQVVRLGFDRNKLVESIRTRQQNEASITYWLLLDNRRRMPSSGYLAHEMAEAVAAANASFLGQPGGAQGEGYVQFAATKKKEKENFP
jgi:5'-AMP-activated protein kinase catalytic alpha subunit